MTIEMHRENCGLRNGAQDRLSGDERLTKELFGTEWQHTVSDLKIRS
jgi:hypothetical protein